MYTYNIYKYADTLHFKLTCEKIEEGLHGLKKEELRIDVDGTLIQIYRKNGMKIKVMSDYDVDAVYVDSEVDLTGIL